jgi:hypothetical protein
MKRLSLIVALCLTAGLLPPVVARTATNYNNTVSGFQTATAEGVAVLVDAAGDLPGMGKVTLRNEGGNVTGGSWTMTVLPPGADASASERGKLSGAVTGGTVTFKPDGTLAGMSAVQLTIEGGTGQYANVGGGTGTLNLSADAEKPSQYNGTLVLDF